MFDLESIISSHVVIDDIPRGGPVEDADPEYGDD